ncbi:Fe-S cluster assembly protein SufB [Stetteria hydrogenophila]
MADEILGPARPVPRAIEIRGKISRSLVEEISRIKKEPDWMRRLRLRALELFEKLPTPKWVVGVEELDLDELAHYARPNVETTASSWDELPKEIREYYEKLGIPEIEAKVLAGLSLQFDSEPIYKRVKEMLKKKGVIMVSMDEAVRKYPDLVKKYFGRVYPMSDHKFAALHYALWSGGVFVYVPPGVKVYEPIESFLLVGNPAQSVYDHTIVVVDEGGYLNFIEGCSAPRLMKHSFHNGTVEVYAHKGAVVKFTTMQNWSRNIINFNNKRGIAEERARIDWIEGSIGSKITYTYPSTILKGRGSSSSSIVVQIAKGPYLKDTGSKMIHLAPDTRSRIVNKSISAEGGVNIYRGLIRIPRGARNARSHVECQSLILNDKSYAYTYPHNQIEEPTAQVTHEAVTGRLGEEQLFYLMQRGLSEGEAVSILVLGFLEEVIAELPFEYANILRRVVEIEFSKLGGVG